MLRPCRRSIVLPGATSSRRAGCSEAVEIDVLVADIELPGSSGDLFAAEARSVRPALRLVFATGMGYIKDVPAPNAGRGPVVLEAKHPVNWQRH